VDLSIIFSDWSFEPQIVIPLLVGAVLYALGLRYSRQRGIARYLQWWHVAAFFGALAAIFIALESPIDAWADTYLWVHMIQHELLILVAAPLLLLGEPLWPMWRGLPRAARRESLRWVLKQRWRRHWWHAISRVLGAPVVAWVLFVGIFTAWHLPPLYDLTLENQLVHNVEHLLFLTTALLFWVQVIPSRPFTLRLGYVQRAFFVLLAAIEMNIMAFALAIPSTASYPYYAALPRTAGQISAITDQHAAAGVMDVPATVIFFAIIWALLALWLRDDERAGLSEQHQPQPSVSV
jgi:cytochrome c oxidase assembly factor CtaG